MTTMLMSIDHHRQTTIAYRLKTWNPRQSVWRTLDIWRCWKLWRCKSTNEPYLLPSAAKMRERERESYATTASAMKKDKEKKTTQNNMSPQKSQKRRRKSFIKKSYEDKKKTWWDKPQGKASTSAAWSLSLSLVLFSLFLCMPLSWSRTSAVLLLRLFSSSCLPSFPRWSRNRKSSPTE